MGYRESLNLKLREFIENNKDYLTNKSKNYKITQKGKRLLSKLLELEELSK